LSFGADKCKPQSIRKDKHFIHGFQLDDGGISEPVQEGDKDVLVFNFASLKPLHKNNKHLQQFIPED